MEYAEMANRRTPADEEIERRAAKISKELSEVLTMEEMREYCLNAMVMNGLLQRQLQEQTALMKPMVIIAK